MTPDKKGNRRKNRRNVSNRRLTIESLDSRQLMTVGLIGTTLCIEGSDLIDDRAEVWESGRQVHAELNGRTWDFSRWRVKEIVFKGGKGQDYFRNNTDIPCVVDGGKGKDELYGGKNNDKIHGGGAADIIWGGRGVDYLYGGLGADQLHGGEGNDQLFGGYGDDQLWGDGGNDTIRGQENDDYLYGGSGKDSLFGGKDNDTLVSIDNATSDTLRGGSGFDSFWGDSDIRGHSWLGPFEWHDTIRDADASENATNVHQVRRFVNGADRTLNGDDIADPTDGLFYRNFADRPLFADDGPSEHDVDQGALDDCWLLAAMGAAAHANQNAIHQTVVSLGDGTYAVRLGGTTDGTTGDYYRVDADLPTNSRASWDPIYAGLGMQESLWVAIVEKAYADYRHGANTYASLAWGGGDEAFRGLNAIVVGYRSLDSYTDGREILDDIAGKVDSGLAVSVGFRATAAGSAEPDHEYTVLRVIRNLRGTVTSVVLRNPWGPAGADSEVTLSGPDLFASSGYVFWGDVG